MHKIYYNVPIECGFLGDLTADITVLEDKITRVEVHIASGVKVDWLLSLQDEKLEWLQKEIQKIQRLDESGEGNTARGTVWFS